MTLKQVLFDGKTDGATADSAALTGNTGYTVTAPSTATFTNAAGMRGTTGLHLVVSTATAIIRYDMLAAANNAAFSLVYTHPSNPAANANFFSARTGGGRACSLGISTNGRLFVTDAAAAGGTLTYITPTAGTLTAGTKYRVELRLQGNTTTAGHIDATVYTSTDTTTPLATPVALTNANLSAAQLTQIELGNSGPNAITVDLDDVQMDDGRTTEIGPILTALSTPTVTLGTTTNPTTVGGTNGSQVITWGAVTNATTYDAYKLLNPSGSPVDADFGTAVATGVTSPYTFTGLGAGSYAFGIKAKP